MRTFRVRNVPLEYNEEDLKNALRQAFNADERINILPMFSLVPSCRPESQTQDALLTFHPKTPTFLDAVEKDKTGMTERQIPVDGHIINIDLNFFGITQVSNRPRDGKVDIDLVFVTGLDGNAFGSWASRATGLMWPREFFRDDLPNARVLTFGYGVRVIIKSIVKCKVLDRNEFNKAILDSLKGLVFFGAPHHGLDTKDTEAYVSKIYSDEPTGDARKSLLNELQKNIPAVERELQDFKDLVGEQLKIRVISVYERKPGRRLIQTSQIPNEPSKANATGSVTWKREGDAYNPLPKENSVLGFPSSLELQLPSDSDHSNMTKFDHKDTTYQIIVEELRKVSTKSIIEGFSFESDTTETPIPRFSQLRTSLKLVIYGLRESYRVPQELEALSFNLLQNLAESQVLLELAEDILCRAIILKEEVQLVDIGMTIQDESRNLDTALKTTETLLRSDRFPSLSDVAGNFHTLLQSSIGYNTHLKTLLLEENSKISTPRYNSRSNRSGFNELLSLRCAGDITIASGTLGHLEPEWIPFESLYFPAKPESEKGHEKESWLEKVIQFFTEPESSDLKLKPRRFAALRAGNKFEKVMVEFRPCPEYTSPSELSLRRQGLISTARTILQSNLSTTTRLSIVPLRGVSFMDTGTSRSLLMIYRADALVSLDEAFEKFGVPTVKSRVWLALRYAESIAALHSACFCHGLINPSNLYLQIPASLGERSTVLQVGNMSPMVAGFDIARQVEWSSDLVDVEEPLWRIHLHPERMQRGYNKERQDSRHDAFSLGMVMVEVGFWMLFSGFKKYGSSEAEDKRQDYCIKLRKNFRGDGADNMPRDYRDIISYCLGLSDSLPGQPVNAQQSRLLSELEEPKVTRAVDALSRLYESLP
ncbi:hypothetical protein E0Z10_g5380 [Xylaria hypoxylon]|uniref:Protein kinase domain-containing protein n=1 Tax=Xylaria hypoxylon TaxID=37992 RepID=A0A4Z0YY04_9PEZI|nr:hypothetical protein E0Z10_g5380 [Xylaria hypoxylon]